MSCAIGHHLMIWLRGWTLMNMRIRDSILLPTHNAYLSLYVEAHSYFESVSFNLLLSDLLRSFDTPSIWSFLLTHLKKQVRTKLGRGLLDRMKYWQQPAKWKGLSYILTTREYIKPFMMHKRCWTVGLLPVLSYL